MQQAPTMSKRKKRFVVSAIATVVLLAGVLIAYQQVKAGADPIRFTTQTVKRQSIVATITATGTVSPLKTVQVGSQVSGRVLELRADFNSQVKKGDLLAKIDPQLFQSEVLRASA